MFVEEIIQANDFMEYHQQYSDFGSGLLKIKRDKVYAGVEDIVLSSFKKNALSVISYYKVNWSEFDF